MAEPGAFRALAAAAVLSAAALGLCAWARAAERPAAGRPAPPPDRVVVTRSVSFPTDRFANNTVFAALIASPAASRRLYAALRALPPRPRATMYCPDDLGTSIRMAFWHGEVRIATAVADPMGCNWVTWTGPDGRLHLVWATGSIGTRRFWRALAIGLHRPLSSLYGAGAFLPPPRPSPSIAPAS